MQSLLLSTLSIVDENDDETITEEHVAPYAEQIYDDIANTMSFDSVTSNAPMARASNYDDAKKKQESASHSDSDSHPQHLSGIFTLHRHIFIETLLLTGHNMLMV